ncbi:MAG: DUF3488 and transglutaminase-like domain-containing protein [Jatrophihabitans sp.]
MNPTTARATADALNRRTYRSRGLRRSGSGGTGPVASAAARRTALTLLASALGVIPLKGLFSDFGWLPDAWLTMIIVIAPAALLRLRRPPGALDIWPGIVLLVPWLTLRFAHEHAIAGLVPTTKTWDDVAALMTSLHRTTSHEAAPIHTTLAVDLVVCALLGLLAALVDLIAVVGRRGALAGVPLLVVYTVAGAVPRRPVSWLWFAFAAAAYLLLLAIDADDELEHWGRRVQANGSSRARSALSMSAPRIASAAIAAAVMLPLLVPGDGRNLIANAFHGGNGGGGVGTFGGSGGGKLSPFAALKGQLDLKKPHTLASVHMTSPGDTVPFYLRVNVLSKFTDSGWSVNQHGETSGIQDDQYPTLPAGRERSSVSMQAQIDATGFAGSNPPVFAVPETISGLRGTTTWSPQDQLLLGSTLTKGDRYTIRFAQAAPSVGQLKGAPNQVEDSLRPQLALPRDFPVFARNLVGEITNGKPTPYDKARAINDYFIDPANGFVYDLSAAEGDTGSALVDFLQARKGFCQQYAAAAAAMMRAVGVPARVVLGYMHPAPNAQGDFTVTTADAHSWVEAYFSGVGWIPFDPTPASGLADSARNDLPWAPHSTTTSTGPARVPTVRPASPRNGALTTAPTSHAAKPRSDNSSGNSALTIWLLVLAVVLVAAGLVPAVARWGRRRRRHLAARRDGDTDALWAELSDTAVDLGFVWSPARSPRQVAAWLGQEATACAQSLQALAVAVEHGRYAPSTADSDRRAPDSLVLELREVTGELRARRGGRARLRATWWPASVRWTARWGGGPARRR